MRINKFDAICLACKTTVPTGAGILVGPYGGWRTFCMACKPVPPPRGNHRGWHQGPLATLDFETTGVDPATDRVLSYALVDDHGVDFVGMVNPGVAIPSASAAVHGITDRDVAAAPTSEIAIAQIIAVVDDLIERGVGLVIFNAAYDLSMLRAEAFRHGLAQPDWPRLLVVDPLVIDWGLHRGSLGPRKLTDVAAFYGVTIDTAHEARCDAVAARAIAIEQGSRHVEVARLALVELQTEQRGWFAGRVEDWNRYAAKKGWTLDDPQGWPLSTSAPAASAPAAPAAAPSGALAR